MTLFVHSLSIIDVIIQSSVDSQEWTGQTDLITQYWPVLVNFWNYALSFVDSDGVWVTTNVLADINVGVHCSQSEVGLLLHSLVLQRQLNHSV